VKAGTEVVLTEPVEFTGTEEDLDRLIRDGR
jgi:hypothetical protein